MTISGTYPRAEVSSSCRTDALDELDPTRPTGHNRCLLPWCRCPCHDV